jgi:kynurenine 3-monooxygenase
MLALMKEPTAKLFFNHRLASCDFENKVVTFESVIWKEKSQVSEQELANDVVGSKPMPVARSAEECKGMKAKPVNTSKMTSVVFDFLIGADGTYSSVRQSMMRKLQMDFSQEYLQALWCDFIFPAAKDGSYRMQSTCLHVWPADQNIVMCQPDFVGFISLALIVHT